MRYVIVDLEATCWQHGTRPERQEIIEIGAVLLPAVDAPPSREFTQFVRPVQEPVLSDFCTQLTGIKQADVEDAPIFADALPRFLDWIGPEPYTLCSWGAYDLKQFGIDCARHGLALPFERHLNIKQAFADWQGTRPSGLPAALSRLGLTLEGRHHRGVDDARNIARIAAHFLPAWVADHAADDADADPPAR